MPNLHQGPQGKVVRNWAQEVKERKMLLEQQAEKERLRKDELRNDPPAPVNQNPNWGPQGKVVHNWAEEARRRREEIERAKKEAADKAKKEEEKRRIEKTEEETKRFAEKPSPLQNEPPKVSSVSGDEAPLPSEQPKPEDEDIKITVEPIPEKKDKEVKEKKTADSVAEEMQKILFETNLREIDERIATLEKISSSWNTNERRKNWVLESVDLPDGTAEYQVLRWYNGPTTYGWQPDWVRVH